MPSEPVDKATAGAIIRAARDRKQMTQEQVIERTGIPTLTQLSEYENGKVGFTRGKHFAALVDVLELTAEEVEQLNPLYARSQSSSKPKGGPPVPPFDPRTLFHPPAQQERVKRDLWPNLAQMIEEKQEKYPQLQEIRWQQHLNQTRFSGGQEPDADGWFEMYQAMRRNHVEPEPWPDDD